MKITVITPTYNDGDKIVKTIKSVTSQTYENWELIKVDDGSTDRTKEIVQTYIEKSPQQEKISYYYQDNADQLNAILKASDYIEGDLVYILHSDDELANNNVFTLAIKEFEQQPDLDAIIPDQYIINNYGELQGRIKTKTYKIDEKMLVRQLLVFGRQQYIDVGFFRVEAFKNSIKHTYLTWNMPFWIVDNEHSLSMLKVKRVSFPFFYYRVYDGNYINNAIGKFNVLNGEIRTATTIMNYYHVPLYRMQNIIVRAINKWNPDLIPPMIFKKEPQKNKYQIIKTIIASRYNLKKIDNVYLISLLGFYKNLNSKETVHISKLPKNIKEYQGKDVKKFYLDLENNELDDYYMKLMERMNYGFRYIYCDKSDYEFVVNSLKFLNIYYEVEIITDEYSK